MPQRCLESDNLPARVALHARRDPERMALRFLHYGEGPPHELTYGQLLARSNAVARALHERSLRGQPVVLLFPAGQDYLCALLGCLRAGAIAVPAYPPRSARLGRANRRIAAILHDTGAHTALCSRDIADSARTLAGLELLVTQDCDVDDADLDIPAASPHDACILQYTSGSLGAPKGVIIQHAQLQTNLEMMARVFGSSSPTAPDGPMVTWLPPYHDMGLVGTLLSALYEGIGIVQLAPEAFIRRPSRWLRAVSDYRAAVSVAPNFALDLAVARSLPEESEQLDLRSLRVLITGAEPVRALTLERFSQCFAAQGLSASALCPAYGLAEAVLLVAGSRSSAPPLMRDYDAGALQLGAARPTGCALPVRRLVSCGPPVAPLELRIVDPESSLAQPACKIGEIWLRGPSLAAGYYGQPNETDTTFDGCLQDPASSGWLRTGDLGFLDDGELFVVGRLKEIILVRGIKHHPQDLEQSAQRAHASLVSDAGAAFALEDLDGSTRAYLVQEVDSRTQPDWDALVNAVLQAVQREHELTLHGLLFVKRGSIPKTSSGKVMRVAVRDALQTGNLACLRRWDAVDAQPRPQTRSPEAIESFLRELLQRRNGAAPAPPSDARLFELGIDSLGAAELSEQLSRWLGTPIRPSLLYDHPRLSDLAQALAAPSHTAPARTRAPSAIPTTHDAALAIVGMSCRLPGAEDLEQLWQMLCEGASAVGTASRERALSGVPAPRAGYLSAIDSFDCDFFGLSPREASRTDPQQLLVLELSWRALEDAGIAPSSLAGSDTGVFVGVSGSERALLLAADPERVDADFGLGHAASIVANRVSSRLDLQGPSCAYDSACTSSFAALHAARHSLLSGECDLALVAGVHALFAPHAERFLSAARLLGEHGLCRAFDRAADGLVRGEGCGVIVLKRLPDALAARDRIYACVTGSALLHAGAGNGLAAPSGAAQQRALRKALAQARITAAELGYVEAHGVGSPLADGVELRALHAVLSEAPRAAPCWLGAIKTNIGHLEAASGVASLIKTALVLQRDCIPAHLHLTQPCAELETAAPWLRVTQARTPWTRGPRARHAGVGSFALGGSVAHVVLREAPAPRAAEPKPRTSQLFTLSARTLTGLHALAGAYAVALPGLPLAAACQTANCGREHFPLRRAFVVRDTDSLVHALRTLEVEQLPHTAPVRVMIALEPSAPDPNALRVLYASEPAYRAAYDRAAESLVADADTATVLHDYALLALLAHWNVRPSALIAGPHARALTACIAEIVDTPSGLRLAHQETRLRTLSGRERENAAASLSTAWAAVELRPARRRVHLAPHGWVEIGQIPDRAWLTEANWNADAQLDDEVVIPLGDFPRNASTRWLQGPCNSQEGLLRTMARLYELGADVDLCALEGPFLGDKVSLPGYPLERTPVVEPLRVSAVQESLKGSSRAAHPLLSRMIQANEEPASELASVPGPRTLR